MVGNHWSRCSDAAEYITELPRAEHDAGEWQAATQALLLLAEHDGASGTPRWRWE
jgi:hypothetical protein